MPDSRPLLSLFAILAGAVLVLLGLACVGLYLVAVLTALGHPDRSVIFWYLPFPLIGIPLAMAGIYFVMIGVRAYRDPGRPFAQLRYSLLALVLVALLEGGLLALDQVQTDRQRQAMIRQEEVASTLADGMHKVAGVKIVSHDAEGFTFAVTIDQGIPGSYRLETEVADSQAVFLEDSQVVNLGGDGVTISRQIPFEKLFGKCADAFRGTNIYVCIDNTAATSVFTIRSRLMLLADAEGSKAEIEHLRPELTSAGSAGFILDTRTGPWGVRVDGFAPAYR
ncbi:hypothetical protein [Desulfuromonas sp. TF]|uniref:hypothetical protein n=1 Tax=Desulfuromonas sp. TF TaxID=1232410 RepID=UPI00041F7741|nr:hypothetical protein [Desulfuromonas sp. TF]